MPRLQKVALYYIAVGVAAVAAMAALQAFFGQMYATIGALLVLWAVVPAKWIFRAENGVKLDEMESVIALRAASTGFLFFWIVTAATIGLIPAFYGTWTSVPAWYLSFFPIAGGYVLLVSFSIALLWYAGTGEGGAIKLAGLLALGAALVAPAFVGGALLLRSGDGLYSGWYGVYAGGHEADEWHVTASGTVEAHSRIMLSRWPYGLGKAETPPMRIKLPYADAKVTSVTFESTAVEARNLGGAAYQFALPGMTAPFDTTVEVDWTVPLSSLEKEGEPGSSKYGPYRAELKSLIPTVAFTLRTVADPGSGFRSISYPYDNSTYPFTDAGGQGPLETERGSCSLCVLPEKGAVAAHSGR